MLNLETALVTTGGNTVNIIAVNPNGVKGIALVFITSSSKIWYGVMDTTTGEVKGFETSNGEYLCRVIEKPVPHVHAENIKKWADNPKTRFKCKQIGELFLQMKYLNGMIVMNTKKFFQAIHFIASNIWKKKSHQNW